MARSREFDVDETLDRAMQVFWNKGYEGTSIQDIVTATGVNRASLYQTYGDKRELYRKALNRFGSGEGRRIEGVAPQIPPGLERIREVFRQLGADTLKEPRGCFMLNSATELATVDQEICALGRRAREEVEAFFSKCLKAAAARGEWQSTRKPTAVARFLTNTVFGLRAIAKMQPDRKLVDDIVSTTLAILD